MTAISEFILVVAVVIADVTRDCSACCGGCRRGDDGGGMDMLPLMAMMGNRRRQTQTVMLPPVSAASVGMGGVGAGGVGTMGGTGTIGNNFGAQLLMFSPPFIPAMFPDGRVTTDTVFPEELMPQLRQLHSHDSPQLGFGMQSGSTMENLISTPMNALRNLAIVDSEDASSSANRRARDYLGAQSKFSRTRTNARSRTLILDNFFGSQAIEPKEQEVVITAPVLARDAVVRKMGDERAITVQETKQTEANLADNTAESQQPTKDQAGVAVAPEEAETGEMTLQETPDSTATTETTSSTPTIFTTTAESASSKSLLEAFLSSALRGNGNAEKTASGMDVDNIGVGTKQSVQISITRRGSKAMKSFVAITTSTPKTFMDASTTVSGSEAISSNAEDVLLIKQINVAKRKTAKLPAGKRAKPTRQPLFIRAGQALKSSDISAKNYAPATTSGNNNHNNNKSLLAMLLNGQFM